MTLKNVSNSDISLKLTRTRPIRIILITIFGNLPDIKNVERKTDAFLPLICCLSISIIKYYCLDVKKLIRFYLLLSVSV